MPKNGAKPAPMTDYVVLRRVWASYDDNGEAASEAWVEVGFDKGRRGQEAIKALTKLDEDAYREGDYKAVPVSTWDSEGNNLEIETETKPRSKFKVPSRANGGKPVETRAEA